MAKPLQSGLLLVAALVPLVGAPTLALAIDNKSADYFAHTADCIGWFISDHSMYQKYCAPSMVPASLTAGVIGATATFTDPASSGSSSKVVAP